MCNSAVPTEGHKSQLLSAVEIQQYKGRILDFQAAGIRGRAVCWKGQVGTGVGFLHSSVLRRVAILMSALKACFPQCAGVGMMVLSVISLQQKRRSGPSGR